MKFLKIRNRGKLEQITNIHYTPSFLELTLISIFFVRIVTAWNALPQNVVEANSFGSFKQELKRHMNIY